MTESGSATPLLLRWTDFPFAGSCWTMDAWESSDFLGAYPSCRGGSVGNARYDVGSSQCFRERTNDCRSS